MVISRYIELYQQGKLILDELVFQRCRLEDVNHAFETSAPIAAPGRFLYAVGGGSPIAGSAAAD